MRRIIRGTGLLLAGLLILYFVVRQQQLSRAVTMVEERFHQRMGGVLDIQEARFSNWRTAELSGISLLSPSGDTLFTLDRMAVKIRFWPLLTGRVLPASVTMVRGQINLIYCDSLETNYLWLSRRDTTTVSLTRTDQDVHLNDRIGSMIDQVFRWLPDQVDWQDLTIRLDYVGNIYQLTADQVTLDKGAVQARFSLVSPLLDQHGVVSGTMDRRNRQFDLTLSGQDGQYLTLPGAYEMGGLWTALADARLSLSGFRTSGGQLSVHIDGRTDRLLIAHPRLADTLITLPLLAMNSAWRIGAHNIDLDSTSTWTIDQVTGRMGGSLRLDPGRALSIQVRIPTVPAPAFFASLPGGMFGQLDGLQTEGALTYAFDLYIDENDLDKTVLRSRLTPDRFRIIQFGKTDLRMMNGSFAHQVYEDDRLAAQFLVGPENPDFTPLESISPFLRDAILTCEDPSFFSHRGFLEEAMRESLIQNIREKRFARGGSTISMQLVKNVFLNRKKFLARKVQEILLVWLIEGQRLTSKERMFEVYLNLIEWGPGIYGVRQAAQFYFRKSPADLDLAEAIFLASIVPKPKKYRWYFEGDQLRPQWQDFNRFIANRMASRGLIPPVDSTGFTGQITLLGPAASTLSMPDSTGMDSLLIQPLDLLPADWPITKDSL